MLALSIISLLLLVPVFLACLACFAPVAGFRPDPVDAPRPSQVDRRGLCWSLSLGTSLHRATSVARTDLQAAVAPMRELAGPGSSGSVLLLSSLASRNSRGGNDGGDARRIGPQCIASRSFWAGSLARHATRHAAFNCSRYRVITPGLFPLGPVPKVRSRSSLFTDTRPRRRTGSSARLGRRVERPPLFQGQGCATP